MLFPRFSVQPFGQAIRFESFTANESGTRDLVQSGVLRTTTNRAQTNARWHWEISFSVCTAGVE